MAGGGGGGGGGGAGIGIVVAVALNSAVFPALMDIGSLLMRTELSSCLVGSIGWVARPTSAASMIGVLVLEGTLELPRVVAPDLRGCCDLQTSCSVGNLFCQGYCLASGPVYSSQWSSMAVL